MVIVIKAVRKVESKFFVFKNLVVRLFLIGLAVNINKLIIAVNSVDI